jgi:hypothetical protein
VFLVNKSTRRYTQEKRVISYWFKDDLDLGQRPAAAHGFFKRLVSPADFPRGTCGKRSRSIKLNSYFPPLNCRLRGLHQEDHEADAEGLPDGGQDRAAADAGVRDGPPAQQTK